MPHGLQIRRHTYVRACVPPRHHHPYWHCDHIVVGGGGLRCATAGSAAAQREHTVECGDWWVLPPHCPHAWSYHAGTSILSLRFSLMTPPVPPWRLRSPKALALGVAITELVAGRDWRDSVVAHAVNHCLEAIVALEAPRLLDTAGGGPSGEPGMASRVKVLIKHHRGRPVRVEALAAELRSSPRALRRLFRAETGLRLKDWIDDERTRRIEELLLQGIPVAVIADQLGFSHPSDCTRLFRRVRGVSPRAWSRRSSAGAVQPVGR